MGSSSFNLPNVERALTEMEGGIGGPSPLSTSVGPDTRKGLNRSTTRPSSSLSVPGVGAQGSRTQASSPTLAASPSPTNGGQTQHEVLQNFFQSLLSSKDRAGTTTSAARAATPKPPPVAQPAPAQAPASNGASTSEGAAEGS